MLFRSNTPRRVISSEQSIRTGSSDQAAASSGELECSNAAGGSCGCVGAAKCTQTCAVDTQDASAGLGVEDEVQNENLQTYESASENQNESDEELELLSSGPVSLRKADRILKDRLKKLEARLDKMSTRMSEYEDEVQQLAGCQLCGNE